MLFTRLHLVLFPHCVTPFVFLLTLQDHQTSGFLLFLSFLYSVAFSLLPNNNLIRRTRLSQLYDAVRMKIWDVKVIQQEKRAERGENVAWAENFTDDSRPMLTPTEAAAGQHIHLISTPKCFKSSAQLIIRSITVGRSIMFIFREVSPLTKFSGDFHVQRPSFRRESVVSNELRGPYQLWVAGHISSYWYHLSQYITALEK